MNPNRDLNEQDGLNPVLRQWTVNTPLPPRFQEGVWQRIERETVPQTTARPWLQRLMIFLVPRPRFAYAYVSAFLVAGIAAGAVAAQVKTSRLDSELSMRYVHSIDPYQPVNPQP